MFCSFIGSGGGIDSEGFGSGIEWTIELGGINGMFGLLKLGFDPNGGRGPMNGILPIGPIGIVPGGIMEL